MHTVSVYGNSPNTGPGMLAATAVRDDLNQRNPGWNLQMVWSQNSTQYSSATVPSRAALVAAVSAEFPYYLVG